MKQYLDFASDSYTLPEISIRLRAAIDDPRSSSEDIAALIGVDPSLSAKLLRLANSALFRFSTEVNSIPKAVNVIGGEALYNLVIAETARSVFNCFDCESLDLESFFERSVFTGIVAKYLARELKVRGSDRFFVMGMLQNLSELVVAKANPEAYAKYQALTDSPLPWENQQQVFGFTFSACSGAIMELWQLPVNLCYAVKHLNDNVKLTSDLDTSLLTCAVRLATAHFDEVTCSDVQVITPQMSAMLPFEFDVLQSATLFAQQEANKLVVSLL